jgi:geranylgeranyl reductase family protein
MTTHKAQIVVVGAGPAGAAAAFFLAQAGVDVLMVDQATFPRDKSCGDGLGFYAGKMLEKMGLLEWVSDFSPILRIQISSPNGNSARLPRPPEIKHSYVVSRIEFDARLVERAVEVGARLEQGVRVTDLDVPSTGDGHARLRGEANGKAITLQAPLVIAADGGPAPFTRRLGLIRERAEWVAVRTYFEGDRGDPNQIEIHWEKAVMPGYGWVFPLGGGRANVGIGCRTKDLKRLPKSLRDMLWVFVERNPFARERLQHARRSGSLIGHPLRANAEYVTPYTDRVLVAGEAAGLVNPLTGEGIATAMLSGQIAATHARRALEHGDFTAQGLSGYGRAFHKRFDRLHRSAHLARRVLSVSWLLNRAVRRASHDSVYRRQLAAVILGRDLPLELLKPPMALRALLG